MEATSEALPELECIAEHARAAALLNPLRMRILTIAREPTSATEIAARLRMPRQRVNYHVRRLAEQGLLRRAGRQRKRNMVEQRYVALARGFLLIPDLLGGASPDWRDIRDPASAPYLLALAAQVQSDVSRAWKAAGEQGRQITTLTLKSQFRFESPAQRAEFARALRQAVVEAIARHTSVHDLPGGRPAPGSPYRLVLGCYPYEEGPEAAGATGSQAFARGKGSI